ncbi:hypothetical protein ACTD5D_05590 [Nocardia takedensis]|uniref:hypothetical protein n=1 Tax=Nocardia takedensis TaxID=259390 RepID=UPI0002E6FF55|nr:hypothetical protein [Nocardia takedensis]
MSGEDSKQLSVAELLARNGAQGAQSSGGGRRRRGGRGISVAELTGDLPVIRDGGGHSAHAAPEPEAAEPAYEPPAPEPRSWDATAYEAPRSDFGASSYAPEYPGPVEDEHSPMSGPITRYDPLAGYAPEPPRPEPFGHSARVMPGREMPGPTARHGAPEQPPVSDPYGPGVSDPYGPAAVDPYGPPAYGPAPAAYVPEPAPEPSRGGRRHRPDPDESATEVYKLPDMAEPPRRERAGRNGRRGANGEVPTREGGRQSRADRRRAVEEQEEGPSTAAWSPVAGDYPPAPQAAPPMPEPAPRTAPRREGGLPAWSARRHKPAGPPPDAPESGGLPTAAWSLASQDQQLLSGQTVAGDLLRDGAERAERDRRGRDDLLDADDGPTEYYDEFTGEHEPFDDEDDLDPPPSRLGRSRAKDKKKKSATGGRAARRVEHDVNRRQWLILGGQSAGAAIAGMLLFKGFESMWEMLPWVALALAMIVILGLVALVRILRRTDDILSTVIAVVVGIFVTLGPLAFLLSTN